MLMRVLSIARWLVTGSCNPVRSPSTTCTPIPGSTNYVRVDDLDEAERNVRKKGGQIILARTDIPGMGSFLLVQDPIGTINGLLAGLEKALTWKSHGSS